MDQSLRTVAPLYRRALLLGRASAIALGLLALPAFAGMAAANDRSGELLLPAGSSSTHETADSSTAGADDPVGHDANDDNGVDPVGHDANDDNGTDPAGHDANDDNGGAGGTSGTSNASGTSGSSTSSGRGSSDSSSGGEHSGSSSGEHGSSGNSGEYGGSGGND